ncbi:hypothetical protein ENUP19_0329G0034 [Entamoeba nuttalli]
MTQPLSVCIIQANIIAEKIDNNLTHLRELIDSINPKKKVNLIVLPETFSCGFTSTPSKVAEPSVNGKTLLWMKDVAKEKNSAIVGSTVIEENGKYYNRVYFVTPQQEVYEYNKRHLYTMGNEGICFTKGQKKTVVNYLGWKINLAICYDLRFPNWLRNSKENPYDILLIVACWRAEKRHHWITLTTARAIENQCYVIASNNCGILPDTTPNCPDVVYTGDCRFVDYFGYSIKEAKPGVEQIIYSTLDYQKLLDWRAHFPVLNDADYCELSIENENTN